MEGVAVVMTARAFDQGLSGERVMQRLRGRVMLQNLPSVVAARALSPAPGSRVLDMCASPGGKTSALAALMGDCGSIVALDVNMQKVGHIRALCSEMGVSIVTALRMDATKAVLLPDAAEPSAEEQAVIEARGDHGRAAGAPKIEKRRQRKAAGAAVRCMSVREAPHPAPANEPPAQPFPPESFDYIMLDAPCSALGLRPRLSQPVSAKELRRFASYQRSLMHAAVALLRPGGAMVFSTCTISPLENEAKCVGSLRMLFARI